MKKKIMKKKGKEMRQEWSSKNFNFNMLYAIDLLL